MKDNREKKPISQPAKTVVNISAHNTSVLVSLEKNVNRPGVIGSTLSESVAFRNAGRKKLAADA
jgi:hypothetical protein